MNETYAVNLKFLLECSLLSLALQLFGVNLDHLFFATLTFHSGAHSCLGLCQSFFLGLLLFRLGNVDL